MSDISGVNDVLLSSQLTNVQLHQQINYKVAANTLDAARAQGSAVVALIDQAAEIAQTDASPLQPSLTLASLVSGLGQNLDIYA